jgi:hypothetical protein
VLTEIPTTDGTPPGALPVMTVGGLGETKSSLVYTHSSVGSVPGVNLMYRTFSEGVDEVATHPFVMSMGTVIASPCGSRKSRTGM